MPDKKLTDSEIVKALEEHYKQVDKGYSTHLEYGGKGDEHEEKYIYMLRDILDLINRLQADKQSLIEHLKKARRQLKTAKAEAYKEFAERFIQEDGYNNHNFDDSASILVPEEYRKGREEKTEEVWKLVERIKKELVGDKNVD